MFRAVLVALLVPALVSADPAGRLRKLMPKEQEALVEKAERAQEARRAADAEADGLKRQEGRDGAAQAIAEANLEILRRLRDDGLGGWVFECKGVLPAAVRLKVADALEMVLSFDGMSDEVKKAVRGLGPGDIVSVVTSPAPKLVVPRQAKGSVNDPVIVKVVTSGRLIKSIDKVPAE